MMRPEVAVCRLVVRSGCDTTACCDGLLVPGEQVTTDPARVTCPDCLALGARSPKANGHRWPCAGFYTGNHNEARLDAWSCTCGAA